MNGEAGCGQPGNGQALWSLEEGQERRSEHEGNSDEQALVQRLKEGDEAAFAQLIEHYHDLLLQLARRYVRSYQTAEETVQETWLGVFQGLRSFEGRASLKTWIVRILVKRAQTRALLEKRLLLFSALGEQQEESAVFSPGSESWPGSARGASEQWISLTGDRCAVWPEEQLLRGETRLCIAQAIETLPASQRTVMVLHDLEGRKPAEICQVLQISSVNQRVLLSRARAKVRQVLETYLNEG